MNELVEAIDQHSTYRSRSRVRHISGTSDSTSPSSGSVTPTPRYNQQSGKDGDRDGSDLGTLYSMAENEALVDLCNVIDQLIVAARTLFGSQTFWDHPPHVD